MKNYAGLTELKELQSAQPAIKTPRKKIGEEINSDWNELLRGSVYLFPQDRPETQDLVPFIPLRKSAAAPTMQPDQFPDYTPGAPA